MLHRGLLLVLVAIHGALAQTDCIPNPVGQITLDINLATLFWSPSSNCHETEYMLFILVENEMQLIYTTGAPLLDISFLPYCERFYFEIRATNGHHLSDERHIEEYIPAPQNANLSISQFAVEPVNNSTYLSWQVERQFAHCARSYRVVFREDSELFPTDIYTDNTFLFLDDLIPCGRYEIGVMAIYNNVREGPRAVANYTRQGTPTSIPVLQSLNAGPTYIDLTWRLEPYAVNRCPITAIAIDGPPHINNLIFPIQDSPARPLVNTTLNGLRADSMYMIYVYVINSFGRSRPYPVAVQTFPL